MRTVDLAPEGARFVQTRPMPEGEPLQIALQLGPLVHTIECKGRVCWSKPARNGLHEFGVRFVDLLEEERERINRFLSANKARPALAAV
jgi:PilZ domain-containing protein